MDDTFSEIIANPNLSDKEMYNIVWSGKHISAWYFLRKAIRSSLRHSVYASRKYLEHCQNAKIKCNSLAERVFMAEMNYSMLLPGPLLSVIILSASSIEAFTRHCFISTQKVKEPRIGRHKFEEKLIDFENKPADQRIQAMISEIKSQRLPNKLKKAMQNLISFRNDVMHSDPIYLGKNSVFQRKVNRKKSEVSERTPKNYGGYYPDLTADTRPLMLTHALRSTETHDNLIKHVLGNADSADIIEFIGEVDMTGVDRNIIWGDPIESIDYKQACSLADEMTAMNRELDRVTIKERLDFLKNIKAI